MRLVAGIALLDQAVAKLRIGIPIETALLAVLGAGAGMLLLAGLWTPIAGALVVVIELRNAFSQSGDSWFHIMLATLAAGLTLLGPGACSVDARLFGWKRIDIRDLQR
jgi:putative oxidoreductase